MYHAIQVILGEKNSHAKCPNFLITQLSDGKKSFQRQSCSSKAAAHFECFENLLRPSELEIYLI